MTAENVTAENVTTEMATTEMATTEMATTEMATTEMATVAIIVVSHRTRSLLDACLSSLRPEIATGREIIVLDNASDDGSVEMVRERHPEVRLIASEVNLGFGKACNRAVASSDAAWVLLLNPDTTVPAGTVDALLDLARRHPQGGVYGGRTTAPSGALDPRSCWGLPTPWSTACFALGLSSAFPRSRLFDPEAMGDWPRDTEREVGVVTGCLLLINRRWWNELGGFDERYFMYGEDVDLNLRARAAGARPMITPNASIMHVVGASSTRPDKLSYLLKGKVTIARDHFGASAGRISRLLLVVGTLIRAGVGVARSGRDAPWHQVWRRRAEWWDGY